MLCEKCNTNQASVHYKYSQNGHVTEMHLCSACAKQQGLLENNGYVAPGFMSSVGAFEEFFLKNPFSGFAGNISAGNAGVKKKVCPGCGLSENELRSGGKFGCARCYSTFSDIVPLMLKKMHMSVEYKGKFPRKNIEEMTKEQKIAKLKQDMQDAVDKQEYEQAAKIRDAIRQLTEADNIDS